MIGSVREIVRDSEETKDSVMGVLQNPDKVIEIEIRCPRWKCPKQMAKNDEAHVAKLTPQVVPWSWQEIYKPHKKLMRFKYQNLDFVLVFRRRSTNNLLGTNKFSVSMTITHSECPLRLLISLDLILLYLFSKNRCELGPELATPLKLYFHVSNLWQSMTINRQESNLKAI